MNQSINTDSKNSKEPQQKYRLGSTGDNIRLVFLAKHFAMKRGYKYLERLKFYRLLVCRLLQQNWWQF